MGLRIVPRDVVGDARSGAKVAEVRPGMPKQLKVVSVISLLCLLLSTSYVSLNAVPSIFSWILTAFSTARCRQSTLLCIA